LDEDIEPFACAMYGRGRFKIVDVVRSAIPKEICGGLAGNINLGRNIASVYFHLVRKHYFNISDVPTTRLVSTDIPKPRLTQPIDGQLLAENSDPCDSKGR